jgi:hypothetical protein
MRPAAMGCEGDLRARFEFRATDELRDSISNCAKPFSIGDRMTSSQTADRKQVLRWPKPIEVPAALAAIRS